MSKKNDVQLIWEAYADTHTINNEDQSEMSLDKLVHKGEEHFNKYRGKANHDEILKEIEQTFLQFFNNNYNRYSNAEQIVRYIEDEGFKEDLMNQLGIDDDREHDMLDQLTSRYEF